MSHPSEFYWSQLNMLGFGRMWFPLAMHRADEQGMGGKYLGSVVEENWNGLFNSSSYPSPNLMAAPQLVLQALIEKREILGLQEEIVLESDLKVPSYSMEKKNVFGGGLRLFPGLPASFNLSVDYAAMKRITVEFGGNTRFRYIPTDPLLRLYKHLDGNDKQIDPKIGISIAENYIVDQVLLSDQYSVIFESESSFDGEIESKLQFQNALLENKGKVTVQMENRQRIVAQVQDGSPYLIAFKVIEWEDFG